MKWIKLTVTEELSNNLKLLANFKTTNMSKLIKSFIININEYKQEDFLVKTEQNSNKKTIAIQIEEELEDKLITIGKEVNLSKNQVLTKIIENELEKQLNLEENKEEKVFPIGVRLLKSEHEKFNLKVKEGNFNKSEIIRNYINEEFNINDLKHTTNRVSFNAKTTIYLYIKQKEILENNIKYFNNSKSDLIRSIIQHLIKD